MPQIKVVVWLHLILGASYRDPIILPEFEAELYQWTAEELRDFQSSTRVINQCGLTPDRFSWKKGCGCFSVGERGMDAVARYIHGASSLPVGR